MRGNVRAHENLRGTFCGDVPSILEYVANDVDREFVGSPNLPYAGSRRNRKEVVTQCLRVNTGIKTILTARPGTMPFLENLIYVGL